MKRLLLALLVIALALGGWKLVQRRSGPPRNAGPLLPLAPMVDAGLDGEQGGAVDAKGRVWLWGGALATLRGPSGKPLPRREAARADGVDDVVQVAVGDRSVLALLRDGTVRATGCNVWGVLGVPGVARNACTAPDQWLPLPGLNQVVQLALGRASAYAVRRDGSVWSWGRDEAGAVRLQAAPMPGLSEVQAIALEGHGNGADTVHHLLKRDGSLWAWGSTFRLGLGGAQSPSAQQPLVVPGLGAVAALASRPAAFVTGGSAAAVLADGSVVHFGGESSAVCRLSDDRPLALPAVVPGLRDVAAVAASGSSLLAMGRDGSLWRWGDRHMDSATEPRAGCLAAAEQLLPPGSITALAASGLSALAWRREGGVLAWGHDVALNAGTVGTSIAWADRQVVKGPR